MLIDTHCHLEMLVRKGDTAPLTQEEIQGVRIFLDCAHNSGVEKCITIGTNLIESRNCVALAHTYPSVFATVAIHPNDITPTWRKDLDELKTLIAQKTINKIVAVGECGIDLHRTQETLQLQKDVFRAHIDCALQAGLPLSIHARDAFDEILEVLDEYSGEPLKGVMHCFTGDCAFAREVMQRGFYLGIGGTITYPKNDAVRDVVKSVGLSAIVLETDAPFLAPQYKRGQQNEPAEVRAIAEYIATLLAVDVNEVALTTTNNAHYLFGI